jgi:hypothetical protein
MFYFVLSKNVAGSFRADHKLNVENLAWKIHLTSMDITDAGVQGDKTTFRSS